jgi:dTDP-4-amino-4,6-dideoxygalactose transaminase
MTSPIVRIPAEDLSRQYQQIRWEIAAAIDKVLPSGRYTLGPVVAEFETEMAAYCGVKYCVGVSNGTDALHLALAAMNVGPGDEVITQANTYVATAFAISYVGATPVFVDVEPEYFNMDVQKLEEKITERTKVIIPVHLYGHAVEMDPLMELAETHGLKILEDAAHAHGGTYKGRPTCSLGHAAAVSFYPAKVMGAYGDAGAILTNDETLDARLRVLRYMGQEVKHTHLEIGFQKRLDPLQAAILSVKLRHLDNWIERRRYVAAQYNQLLHGLPLRVPKEADDVRHVYYMYPIQTPKRDALMEFLSDRGIGTQVIYPTPVPMQPCYRNLEYEEADIPVAVELARGNLCLPMFPELSDDEIEFIGTSVQVFFQDFDQ